MDKYSKNFMDIASKLDAVIKGYGELTALAKRICNFRDKNDTLILLHKISEITEHEPSAETVKLAALLKDRLLLLYGHDKILEICNHKNTDDNEKSLEELLSELDSLVGLKNVKAKVNDLITYQKVQKMRKECGLNTVKSTLHLAFTGSPGTGKTTVARIVGRLYKQIGLLSKGHFIEVSRTDLIAGYQGQTALKVKKVIDEAKGGVLFIDEAYSITENDHSDSYGRECLTELTKALEDYRDDLVVIVAGYTEPMNKFFDSNPGLKSRFNTFIEFDDYSPEELVSILNSMCHENDYKINPDAIEIIVDHFNRLTNNKEANFANGRMVRNLYENIILNHAKRVVNMTNPDISSLSIVTYDDVMASI